MFVAHKMKKLSRFSAKEIQRTRKQIEKEPARFDEEARMEIAEAENRLQAAQAGDDLALLQNRLKEYKRAADQYLPLHKISIVREYTEALVIALVLALFIRTFVVQAFKIPSGSMIPTLLVGDHIVVNKFIYGLKIPFVDKKVLTFNTPDRGDIIVFQFPRDKSKDFIKRVVGLPGDQIEVLADQVLINGEPLPTESSGKYKYTDTAGIPVESHLFVETLGDANHEILRDTLESGYIEGIRPGTFSITVPEGQYFMMGDNRDRSNDSRFWGFVDFNLIRGKAMVIYFSWPPKQLFRFGHLVK